MLEAVDDDRTPRGFDPHSSNRIYFTNFGRLVGSDGFHLISELLIQTVQAIVGGRPGTILSCNDGETLSELASDRIGFHVEQYLSNQGRSALYACDKQYRRKICYLQRRHAVRVCLADEF